MPRKALSVLPTAGHGGFCAWSAAQTAIDIENAKKFLNSRVILIAFYSTSGFVFIRADYRVCGVQSVGGVLRFEFVQAESRAKALRVRDRNFQLALLSFLSVRSRSGPNSKRLRANVPAKHRQDKVRC